MIRLNINGSDCDLSENTTIATTLAANKMQDIQTRSGYFTNSISLPLTENNIAIFDNINQVTSASIIDKNNIECEVYDNEILTVKGFAQLEDINETINIRIISGNAEWFTLLEGRLLSDLNMSDLNHVFDITTVNDNRNNTYLDGFVYSYCYYGAFTDPSAPYTLSDWYACIYLYRYLTQIFSEIGYTIDGSLLTDDIFLRSVLPFTNERMFTNASVASPVQLTDFGNLDLTGELVNGIGTTQTAYSAVANPTYDPLDIFKAGASGVGYLFLANPTNYRFDFFVTCDAVITSGFETVYIDLVNQSTGAVAMSWFFLAANGTNPTQIAGYSPFFNDTGVPLVAGNYRVRIKCTTLGATESVYNIVLNARVYATAIIANNGNTLINSEVEMSQSAPVGIKQTDLLIEIFNRFNVLATVNNFAKVITLNKFSDLYENIPNAIDMTDFVDASEPVKVKFEFGDYAKQNWFINLVDENYPLYYGDGKLDITKNSLSESVDVFESKFAPVYGYVYPNFNVPFINIRNPIKKSIPRICTIVDDDYILITIPSLPTPTSNARYLFDELKFDTSLLPTYYEEVADIIEDQKIYTVLLRLNASHISDLNSNIDSGLNFNTPIYLNLMVGENNLAGYFFINEIKQYILGDVASCEVDLVRLIKR